jgi:hypothetical protein
VPTFCVVPSELVWGSGCEGSTHLSTLGGGSLRPIYLNEKGRSIYFKISGDGT